MRCGFDTLAAQVTRFLAQAFITGRAAHLLDAINPHFPLNDFVFDFGMAKDGPVLIELNPYGRSDPCLFGSYAAIVISEHVSGASLEQVLKRFHGRPLLDAINPAYVPAPEYVAWHWEQVFKKPAWHLPGTAGG